MYTARSSAQDIAGKAAGSVSNTAQKAQKVRSTYDFTRAWAQLDVVPAARQFRAAKTTQILQPFGRFLPPQDVDMFIRVVSKAATTTAI